MKAITANFNSIEFDCHDGTPYPEKWIQERLFPLCQDLEKIRSLTNQPIKILSGFRTPSWNVKVGGKIHSQHLEGMAADIVLAGMNPIQLGAAIENLIEQKEISEGGVGIYKTFVHYDRRGEKARWGISKN